MYYSIYVSTCAQSYTYAIARGRCSFLEGNSCKFPVSYPYIHPWYIYSALLSPFPAVSYWISSHFSGLSLSRWVVSSLWLDSACLTLAPVKSWPQDSWLGGSVGRSCMQCKLNLSHVRATLLSCWGFFTKRKMEKIFHLLCFYKILTYLLALQILRIIWYWLPFLKLYSVNSEGI